MIDDILLEAEDKMDKAVDAASHEFASIRTGRATTSMFAQLSVEYYGAPTPMQQLASFQIPEARMVIISPFDRTATQEILRTLRESDLGVNPTDDGNIIRVVLPALTEERRKEYVKQAKSKAEDGRVSVRGVRRKAKDQLDRLKKDGEASEDDVDRAEKALDAATRAHTDQIDKMLAAKESELLTI
ncbi:ribosome recycling factor [Schaalia georgiae F0490]|uniref:Ribosome-recycling factor n=1 Tax=Schaalia georgiae F0490 TaxID=1125717 RepID=J0NJY3_9ACTO|nr:ribosome recycling factor [Schaalia georgiae]EJF47444.1 ribosome recycling factor [Schaalia georgiae F0490]